MTETGWTILPTSNNDDDGTYNAWGSPNNVHTDNSSAADAQGSGGALSVWFWSGFDFATAGLGAGDTVTNVEVRARIYDAFDDTGTAIDIYWDDSTSTDFDTIISGLTATRMPVSGSTTGTSSSPEIITRDIQGTQPTASELLDANFQLCVRNIEIDSFTDDARIEALWVNVTYTPAGAGGTVNEKTLSDALQAFDGSPIQ
jgi:hypothetical protein